MPDALSVDSLRMRVGDVRQHHWRDRNGIAIGTAAVGEARGSFIGVHSASDTWHDSAITSTCSAGEVRFHPHSGRRCVRRRSLHLARSASVAARDLRGDLSLQELPSRPVKMLLSLRASPEGPQAGSIPVRTRARSGACCTPLSTPIDVWTSAWFRQHLSARSLGLRRDIPRDGARETVGISYPLPGGERVGAQRRGEGPRHNEMCESTLPLQHNGALLRIPFIAVAPALPIRSASSFLPARSAAVPRSTIRCRLGASLKAR